MRKVAMLFLLSTMAINLATASKKSSALSVIGAQEPSFSLTENDDIKIENFKSAYNSGLINLEMNYGSNIQFKGVEVDGGNARVVTSKNNMIKVNLNTIESDSKLKVKYVDEFGVDCEKNVFVASVNDKYYASTSSIAQAKVDGYYEMLNDGLITKDEFRVLREKAVQNVPGEYRISSFDTTLSMDAQIRADFSWKTRQGSINPVANLKVDVVLRTFLGESDEIFNDEIIDDFVLDEDGTYDYMFDPTLVRDGERFGIYFRINAASSLITVGDKNGVNYYYTTNMVENVKGGYGYLLEEVIDMSTEAGKSIQVAESLMYASEYARYLTENENIPNVRVYYGEDGTGCYYSYNTIHLTGEEMPLTSPYPSGYENWDTMGHEYGHHIQRITPGISNNPGGTHYVATNNADSQYTRNGYSLPAAKSRGMYLSWAEGWATYFGQKYQNHFKDYLNDIAYTNDDYYTSTNGVKHSMLTKGYYNGSTYGEADEVAISQALYQLDDPRTNGNDIYGLGDKALWNMITSDKTNAFYIFYDELRDSVADKNALARFLAEFNITPSYIKETNETSANTPAVLKFDDTNGSVYFKYDTYTVYISTPSLGLVHTATISKSEYRIPNNVWKTLMDSEDREYTVVVSAKAKEHYETADYFSEEYTFELPEGTCTLKGEVVTIKSNVYKFSSSYNTSVLVKSHKVDDISFKTETLRCGYITGQYTTISPKRKGYGEAYIAYTFEESVESIELDLAMWSAKEGISSANSTVTIDYYDEETNEWVSAIDLLDGSLPQDKDTLKTYYVTFGAGVKSFRVYAKTPATGSSNNGRIVIGDLKVQF